MSNLIHLDPNDTELVFNLWAFAEENSGFVFALAGRAYQLSGTDEEKVKILKSLSLTDYHIAKRVLVPERFKVIDEGVERSGYTTVQDINDPRLYLFEVVYQTLEKDLPPMLLPGNEIGAYTPKEQKIPQNPLYVSTILLEDEYGHIKTSAPSN
jgi:hypothetical protein